jgi:hypothetical protein
MDLRFTSEEIAFHDVPAFIHDNLPPDIRGRMRLGHSPRKDDAVRWYHRGMATRRRSVNVLSFQDASRFSL